MLAVHIGAGVHAVHREQAGIECMKNAVRAGYKCIKDGQNSQLAVVESIKVMEDDPRTNCGYGSTLTLDGHVECDASIMDGSGLFGAVGAVRGVKNTIQLSYKLLQESVKPLSANRVQPIFLVGEGARQYAIQHQIEACQNDSELLNYQISEGSREKWQTYTKKIKSLQNAQEREEEGARRGGGGKQSNETVEIGIEVSGEQDKVHDTVGAVCIDFNGKFCAGVSSGGIAMKLPGRVGDSAVFGCGCYAINPEQDGSKVGVAISVTGTGERLISSQLAGRCAEGIRNSEGEEAYDDIIASVIEQYVLTQPFPNHAGVLACVATVSDGWVRGSVHTVYAAKSMGVAACLCKEGQKDASFLLCEINRSAANSMGQRSSLTCNRLGCRFEFRLAAS
eukprot:TRINITY_DN6868_c0_g1_i1.p1 TRINITY_DN6868_c0_g1~~TRINITY_DN6868_c0_g1_i1.p1  ORF type:complete len:416 (-),score=52.93 TRINITY_DN6868_c0_g1_i1:549-1727(-)